jgi:hypothetical protein
MTPNRPPAGSGASAGPETLLRAHVETILDRSAVALVDREDVAEELYGHLWQRWQDGLAAGSDSEAAMQSAIEAFGAPAGLGRDLTLAYHSRLYASTIGVLLPAIAPPSDRPRGLWLSRALLVVVAALQVLGVGIVVVADWVTPGRALVALPCLAVSFAMMVLAYKALARQQRWALVFVQVLAVGLVVAGVADFVLKPVTISLLGILALFVLPTVRRPELAAWVAGSRPVRLGLGIVIVATVSLPWASGWVAASMPDPTTASPDDLGMQVQVVCTRTDGKVVSGSIQVDLRWRRTDLLPNGLLGVLFGMRNTDNLGLSSAVDLYYIPDDLSRVDPLFTSASFVDTDSGKDAGSSVIKSSSNAIFDVGAGQLPESQHVIAIDPGTIVAGRTYRGAYSFLLGQRWILASGDEPVFRVRYDHQHRFGVEAIAMCGQTVTGHAVAKPEQGQPPVP